MPSHDRADRRPLPFPTHRTLARIGDDHAMNHRATVPTPIGSRLGAGHPSNHAPRRSHRSAATTAKEQLAMHSFHQGPGIHYAHAEARRRDILAEAERARLLAQVAPVASRRTVGVAAMRRQVGAALVRAGQRMQGVGSGSAAAEQADALPAVGNLRVVR